jgi:hypothetical protein
MKIAMTGGRWYRVGMTAGAMLFMLLLAASYRFLESHGVFTAVKPVSPGACRTIAAVEGLGDIAVDPAMKSAFLAAAARTPSQRDGLYTYSYGTPGAGLVKLAGTPADFHPTALALYRPPGGKATLYAVNRRSSGDYAVQSFRVIVAGGVAKLEERSSIAGRILSEPSDIAAVDEDRFYVVNRHTSRTALGRWLDDVFGLPRANTLYFDGTVFRVVAKQLNSPGGAALSPDASRLIVSEFYPRRLVTFTRNPYTGELKAPAVLPLPAGPGKMELADGSLIVAAWPKASAGEVLRVNLQNGVPQAAVPLYAGRDEEIAAAAETGGHLLIGTGGKILDCRL